MRYILAGASVAIALLAGSPARGSEFFDDELDQAFRRAKKEVNTGRALLGSGVATVIIALPVGIGAGFIYATTRPSTFGCDNCVLGNIAVGAAVTAGVALSGLGLVVSGAAVMSNGDRRMWEIERARLDQGGGTHGAVGDPTPARGHHAAACLD